MTTFIVDADRIETLTATLRRCAEQISDIPGAGGLGTGPTAPLDAALAEAILRTNDRGHQVRDEALRLADVMDLAVSAATVVDSGLGRTLEGMRP